MMQLRCLKEVSKTLQDAGFGKCIKFDRLHTTVLLTVAHVLGQ